METGLFTKRVILALITVLALSSLSGCIIVPGRGYGGGYHHVHDYR